MTQGQNITNAGNKGEKFVDNVLPKTVLDGTYKKNCRLKHKFGTIRQEFVGNFNGLKYMIEVKSQAGNGGATERT